MDEQADRAPRRKRQAPGQAPGNHSLDDFLAEIGGRVREARAKRGMTRRILANDSGVSERYLAKLEGGTANPSAAVLRQLAQAMDYPIADFVPGAQGVPNGMEAVVGQLRTIGVDRMAEAASLLAANFGAGTKIDRARRIALIGLRGAGKSTLGRRLAESLDVVFVELNRLVEQDYGASVGELLALSGQPAFRRHELRCLEKTIAGHEAVVIATGGGIVTEPQTFDMLLRHCHCIWLQAKPDDHMSRVMAQGDLRPMARNREAMKDLKSILAARTPLYERAVATFNTSGRDENACADALLSLSRKLIG